MDNDILEILVKAYGIEKGTEKLEQHTKLNGKGFTVAKLISKHGHLKAEEIFLQKVKNDSKKGTLIYYVEKYGLEEGTKRYKEKNSKLSVSINSLKLAGKTDEEIKEIKSRHASKSARTLENYVNKYGLEKGTIKFNDWNSTHNSRSCWSVDFYTLRGFTRDEAVLIISDKQCRNYNCFIDKGWTLDQYIDYCKRKTIGFTKESYIKKYGELDGLTRYNFDRTKGCSLNFLIDKYGESSGQEKFNSILKAKVISARDSKIQLEFSDNLYSKLEDALKNKFFGMPKTTGFWINYDTNEFGIKCSIPDIRIGNILIEFDGTYWHNLPEVQNRDLEKMILNSRCGFTTIRVWEHEYKEDKENCIDRVLIQIEELYNINFKWGKYED